MLLACARTCAGRAMTQAEDIAPKPQWQRHQKSTASARGWPRTYDEVGRCVAIPLRPRRRGCARVAACSAADFLAGVAWQPSMYLWRAPAGTVCPACATHRARVWAWLCQALPGSASVPGQAETAHTPSRRAHMLEMSSRRDLVRTTLDRPDSSESGRSVLQSASL